MTNDPALEITRRTERYWYQDGIWEIGFGLINALLCGFYWLVAQWEWKGPLAIVLMLLQMGVIISIFLVINRVVRLLKERITYPRTGYVAYRRPQTRARVKRALLSGFMAIGIAILIGAAAAARQTPNRMPLVTGIVMAGALIYLGFRFGLLRLYATAALTIALGYIISLVPLSEAYSTTAFFGGFSLLMMLSGGITLLIFIRSTRLASSSDDYEAPNQPAALDADHDQ